ncbi:MAG TPA: DASS family sodium-coupled anion symporter [bacterium]|nr:DASS family sodium-coupled anion symporter [bacterium]
MTADLDSPDKQKRTSTARGSSLRKRLGLLLGPVLFLGLFFMPTPAGLTSDAQIVLAGGAWIAAWWITEAIPIAATALLPIVIFPVFGVMSTQETTAPYANHLVFLFMGGFLIALAMEKWNLHRRIALTVIQALGQTPKRIILGFMVATALLSMWISNTATAMMMTPIGLAVIKQVGDLLEKENIQQAVSRGEFQFGTALMLGIAYSASIGGVATIIGTPPNAVFVGIIKEMYDVEISFAQWLLFGIPLSVIFVMIIWYYLTSIAFSFEFDRLPVGMDIISRELKKLGPLSREELKVLIVFGLVAILWIARGFFLKNIFPMMSDATIAIFGAALLFVIPVDFRNGEFVLDWKTATRIPWGILLLFGGGISLAEAFQISGLAKWLAGLLAGLSGAPMIMILLAVVTLAIFLTEMTSNTATSTMLMPIMASLALAVGINPFATMVTAAVATSFAFMLPVATPPNAIVFGSGFISIPTMARTGVVLNLLGIVLVTLAAMYWLPVVWGVDLSVIPIWAQ